MLQGSVCICRDKHLRDKHHPFPLSFPLVQYRGRQAFAPLCLSVSVSLPVFLYLLFSASLFSSTTPVPRGQSPPPPFPIPFIPIKIPHRSTVCMACLSLTYLGKSIPRSVLHCIITSARIYTCVQCACQVPLEARKV